MRIKVSDRQRNEMSRVGDLGEFEVQVWSKDCGPAVWTPAHVYIYIPHVHVYSEASGLDACIKLTEPMYFPYGPHVDILNESQRKIFNEFMHRPHRTGIFATNYEYAVFLWNNNYPEHEMMLVRDINRNVVIPDYSEIAKYEPNRS